MRLSRRHQFLLLSGLATAVAKELADRLLTTGYRVTARREPPEDLQYRDVNWPAAVLWTAGVGALVGVTELLARHGADVAWRRWSGTRPPRRRRRPRYRSLRQAIR